MEEQVTCTEALQLIPWLLDNELDATQILMVENHLRFCGGCRSFWVHEQELRKVVCRASETIAAPRSLRLRVCDTLLEFPKEKSSFNRLWPAAVAALALTMFIFQANIGGGSFDWEKLMGSYHRNLPMDVKIPDSSQVQSYLSGRLPFAVRLPQFKSEAPPNLLGGRVTQVDNQDVAYVRYKMPRGNLSIFLHEDTGFNLPKITPIFREGDRGMLIQRFRGYSVARWKRHGIVYSVVSDLPERDFRVVLTKKMIQ